jgi:hypothetical protein
MGDAWTFEHKREFYEYAGVRFLCTPCAYLVRAAYEHFDAISSMEAFMPIRRSKILLELYRRVNRLIKEQRRTFPLGLARKNQRPKSGDPKREQKTIARANR